MGRYWLIAIMLLAAAVSSVRGDTATFAREELQHYLGNSAEKTDVAIDATLAGGGEAFSISRADDRIRIVATDANMALMGVYQLLERAGYRFLAPDFAHYKGTAQIAPPRLSLDSAIATPIVRKPKLKFRKLYVEEGHSHDIENLKQLIDWMPKAGYNTLVVPMDYQGRGRVKWDNWRDELTPELQKRGITIEVGGHGYQNFLNAEMEGGTLFEKHPEWFGQDQQGCRRKEHSRALCTSNAGAVAYLTKNVIAYVQARAEIQIFDLWPPDGVSWCQCEPCEKLGAPAERQALLLNHVRKEVAKVRPDLRLEGIAYHKLSEPPRQVKLDPSVLIDFCPSRQNFEFTLIDPAAPTRRPDPNTWTNGELAANLKAWRSAFDGDISIYSYYRRYAWDSLPVVMPRFLQAEVKWFSEVPVQGISSYCEPDDWFTYELNHFVLPRLAWDPDLDLDALIDDYLTARYGDDAGAAKVALQALEQTVRTCGSVQWVSLKSLDQIAPAQEKVAAAIDCINEAQAAASDDSIRRNFCRLLLMLEYASRDLAIQKMRAGGASEEKIRVKAQELHRFVSEHADEGVFLVKNHRLSLARLLGHYGIDTKGER